MSEKELKITEEELKQIKAQVQVRGQLISDIGSVEAEKHKLLHALSNVLEKTKETADGLEEKYGKVNINLEDGSYKVVEEEKEEEVAEEK